MAVLPTELENVPDDFLHQLKGLLDLGLNQGGEVNYSHVNLQREEIQTAGGGLAQTLKLDCRECAHGNVVKESGRKRAVRCDQKGNVKCAKKKQAFLTNGTRDTKLDKESERGKGLNTPG